MSIQSIYLNDSLIFGDIILIFCVFIFQKGGASREIRRGDLRFWDSGEKIKVSVLFSASIFPVSLFFVLVDLKGSHPLFQVSHMTPAWRYLLWLLPSSQPDSHASPTSFFTALKHHLPVCALSFRGRSLNSVSGRIQACEQNADNAILRSLVEVPVSGELPGKDVLFYLGFLLPPFLLGRHQKEARPREVDWNLALPDPFPPSFSSMLSWWTAM